MQLPRRPVFWHCYWNTLNYLRELSWIQQLVWWKRTSVCEVFLSRAPLRNGGGSTAITQIQIPPKSHKQRCQAGRGPSHPPYNSTRQTGYLEVSGDTSLWIVLSSHSWKLSLYTPKKVVFLSITYFEYHYLSKMERKPFLLSSTEDSEQDQTFFLISGSWKLGNGPFDGVLSLLVWYQNRERQHHLGTWNGQYSEFSPDRLTHTLLGWGQAIRVLTSPPWEPDTGDGLKTSVIH